ncbi:MAG: transporter substrate-binding domain-containing protein [Prevotella sp.]|nr:transporter substrate-binding domain-containing protein [Prevotella sp.]
MSIYYINKVKGWVKWCLPFYLLAFFPLCVSAHQIDGYDSQRPVVVVCDWNKAPYEFLNDHGDPAGSNIDILNAIFKELNLPVHFVMKEWGNAVKTFERGEADLILANTRRYTGNKKFCWTENIINYNRIVAATTQEVTGILSLKRLVEGGVVLKPEDYTKYYFLQEDSAYMEHIDFQAPKTAIMGLEEGDYSYFVWGEEPIKWKLKELNIENVNLTEVNIPISEIHIIGYDKALIDALDDHYSRMKQRGEVEQIVNRWLHPERVTSKTSPLTLYIIGAVLLLGVLFYLLVRLARAHVLRATRESSDLNNMIYKALHMGNFNIMVYDIEHDRFTEQYGHILPAEGISLKEFAARIHPNEQEEFNQKMQQLLAGRERTFDLAKRWNAGTADAPRWLILEGHAMLELDSHGRPAYIINAVNNITHDVEQEHDTYEMKKRYDVLRDIPLIATSFYDKGGYLIEANDTMKEICGFKNDSKVERFWRKVCMFDVPLFRNAYSPEYRHDLYVCQHMNYPEMGIDRYIEFHVHPLLNSQGELINYFVAVADVTDEYECYHSLHAHHGSNRLAERHTRFYARQLKELVECGNLLLWQSNIYENSILFYKSPTDEHPLQQSFDEFISQISEREQDVARYYFTNTSSEQTEINAVFHFVRTNSSNNEAWLNMMSKPRYNAKGNVIGHQGIFSDMTQTIYMQRNLHEVTQRAKAAGQLKSGFMASMTHELRTPLNAIMGFTEILRITEQQEERTEYIRIVRNSCDMLVRLINDIFEASNITEGPVSIKPAKVDFAKSFDDICLMLEQRVAESGLKFLKDNPYQTFPTTLDIGRIQQVLTNFVTNAVKFTKEGHIKLGYRYERDGLYIYCEDTGMGILPDKQNVIFDRFVKLDEFSQGTGLGLNICKSITERCGGEIGVKSEGKDKGSTFWVWIPCKQILHS